MKKMLVRPTLAVALMAGAALACGDEDKKGGGSSNPAECPGSLTGNVGSASCSQAQLQEYGDCVQAACQEQYQGCFGPSYRDGEFAGPCAAFAECLSGCDCDDDACRKGCRPATDCTKCSAGFTSCGLSCAAKLACAFGAGAAGADGGSDGKTCEDLLACCASLTDATRKQQCTMSHAQFQMLGLEGQCGPVYTIYCGS